MKWYQVCRNKGTSRESKTLGLSLGPRQKMAKSNRINHRGATHDDDAIPVFFPAMLAKCIVIAISFRKVGQLVDTKPSSFKVLSGFL
jgi:hypothetical protein